ncbi:MAG: hypothetical protein WBP45_07900 [Daejeonella sp.]
MKAFILLILPFCFVGCKTQKENLIGIWKTEDGKEKLFIHKLYDDLIIDYSTEVMGHSVTVFSTEATFNDNVLTLKNTFFANRSWPNTIVYKNNQLIYQNNVFKINEELTSICLKSLKEQEEKEQTDKLNNLETTPFISNAQSANVGKISQLLKFKSHDELVTVFGNKVQKLFTAMIGKTEIPFGSVLYRDEVNQVIFLWKDNSFANLQALFITPKAEGNNYVIPDWEFDGGIKVGMTAAELVELNGKRIDFMGLGNFNKSGIVLSFNNGQLSKLNLFPEIETTGTPLVSVYNNFTGYKKITSDDKYFDKLGLRIRSIWVLNKEQPISDGPITELKAIQSTFLEDYFRYQSHDDLIRAFGNDNVDKKESTDSQGELQYSSVIFPNTDKQLEFVWKAADNSDLKFIKDDIGNGEYAKPTPSFYSTHQGLKIKLSLDALCDLNKKPVTFYGFEWDNGGALINWSNGALNASKIDVTLGYSGDIPYSKASALTGAVQLKSDSKEVKQSGISIFIKTITISPH